MVDVPVFKRKTTVDPVAPTFVRSIDLLVTRDIMEYPTEDVNFTYLTIIDKLEFFYGKNWHYDIVTKDSFADKAVEIPSCVGDRVCACIARFDPATWDCYWLAIAVLAATEDLELAKVISNVTTFLGKESVDLSGSQAYLLKLSCSGTSIKGYRDGSVRISVTDTDLSSGRFGFDPDLANRGLNASIMAYLRPPSSPSLKAKAFFEVPIIGDGTIENPFRPQMPEEIVDHPEFGKVNRLALSYGALIKSVRKTGKPKEYIAIVRIFDQPIRQNHLYDIPKCISALEAISGVKRLKREEAIKRALKLDDKLTEKDVKDW